MNIYDAIYYLNNIKNKTIIPEVKEALEMGICALGTNSITQCCGCKKYILKCDSIEDEYGADYCKKCYHDFQEKIQEGIC